ncbi:carbohydrate kinase family protein [uncultured Cellulomonas sp.]|uniref:carbohydrate kinase family protein n=1 Tax=uncultured Cellulomonas sp. TaxID=189682 RepID=UPI0028E53A7A|nr:carbohydrate kinase family protein [uncultured Cellulomonas sp.]
MPRVLVNGPASWNLLVQVPVLPEKGSPAIFATRHHAGLGGTSAGKALTLAALGVDVTLRTSLADDPEGDLVRAALAHPRIALVNQPVARTEQHLNLMTGDGSRVSVYLELPDPEPGPVPPLDGFDAAVLDLAEHSRPLLAEARAGGVPVWCDLHDADDADEFRRDFLAAADVLLVSAERLTNPRAYLADAVARGCRLAVCTDGGRGAIARDADGWIEVGATSAGEVVDTNGAGDAFFSGLLSGVLDGLPVERALARASAAGAIAVTTRALGAPSATVATVDHLATSVAVRRV